MEVPKTTTKPPAPSGGGGGFSGFFKRLWYYLKFLNIGLKWNFIELFTFHKKFDLKKVPRRPGDVAVITGGARGIGLEVIRKLLILDMHVIIGCRNEASGQEMVDKFRKAGIVTGSTEVIGLDLMSLESVRDFGNSVLAKYSKIHVLINNAGIMAVPYKVTKDGFESQFQVNYLSHFLLTNMLLPKLIKTGRPGKASRIVNVSSAAQYGGVINFEDINMQQMYSAEMAYMASKLMQVVTTRDLDSRLAKEGFHLKVYAVHPGVVKTDLYEHICLARVFGFVFRLLYKTPEQGADGVLFAAISSKFEGDGGLFFANCKKNSVNKLAKDPEIQKRLWDLSCQLTEWTDIPLYDLFTKTMASSRATKPSTDKDVTILPQAEKVNQQPRKSETESIKRALEPMKFIDDLPDIEEQDIPDFQDSPDMADPRSSSSSSSSSKSISDDPSTLSISSKSSTATVIAGTPNSDIDFESASIYSDKDASVQIQDKDTGLTGPERNLLVNIGILPPDVQETYSSMKIEIEQYRTETIEGGDSSFLNHESPSPSTATSYFYEVDRTSISVVDELKSTSISYDHESTTSSFVYEST